MCFQKCSNDRQKHLDSLYDFVSRATQELIWLNEKEEEEVAFDWSERNSNISRKRDYHAVSPFNPHQMNVLLSLKRLSDIFFGYTVNNIVNFKMG